MSDSRSPTFDYIKEKMLGDPTNTWRPTPEMIAQVKKEWATADAERERRLQERLKQEPRDSMVITDWIELPPDWYRSRVTPAKIQWYLDRNWSIEDIAKELGKTEESIKRILARGRNFPAQKPKPSFTKETVPYGWRIVGDIVKPDDSEQWVLEKMTRDRKSGKKLDDIAGEIERLGIKPKRGGLWFGRRVLKAIRQNQELWEEYNARKGFLRAD